MIMLLLRIFPVLKQNISIDIHRTKFYNILFVLSAQNGLVQVLEALLFYSIYFSKCNNINI